jgi:hypothetical protein
MKLIDHSLANNFIFGYISVNNQNYVNVMFHIVRLDLFFDSHVTNINLFFKNYCH